MAWSKKQDEFANEMYAIRQTYETQQAATKVSQEKISGENAELSSQNVRYVSCRDKVGEWLERSAKGEQATTSELTEIQKAMGMDD